MSKNKKIEKNSENVVTFSGFFRYEYRTPEDVFMTSEENET